MFKHPRTHPSTETWECCKRQRNKVTSLKRCQGVLRIRSYCIKEPMGILTENETTPSKLTVKHTK